MPKLTQAQENRAFAIVAWASVHNDLPLLADDPMVAHRVDQLVVGEPAKSWDELDPEDQEDYREEVRIAGNPGVGMTDEGHISRCGVTCAHKADVHDCIACSKHVAMTCEPVCIACLADEKDICTCSRD